VWLSTTTMTNGWSSLGSVTSTKTESETRTIYSFSTVISPSVTTLPGELSDPSMLCTHQRGIPPTNTTQPLLPRPS
jgi:hypothetical protein